MADEPSNAMTDEDLDSIFDMDAAPIDVVEDEETGTPPVARDAEGASELTSPKDEAPPVAAAPEPEPEPEAEPQAEEEPAKPKIDLSIQLDSVGEPEPEQLEAAPDWLTSLPDEQRAYVEELRKDGEGMRHALARRREQISTLENQRREAYQVAHELRTQMQQPAAPAAEAKPAEGTNGAKAPAGIAVQVTEDGQVIIPQEELTKLVQGQVQPQFAQQTEAMQADAQRRDLGTRLLRDAEITEKTEEALAMAWTDYVGALQQEAVTRGVMPADRAQEIHLAQASGLEQRLQQKYPGLTVAHLYDLQDGISAPQLYGHRLTDVTKRYQEAWGLGAAPVPAENPLPPEKRVPKRAPKDHPGTLANAGTGSKVSADTALEGLDQLSDNPGEALLSLVEDGPGGRDAFWADVDKELGLGSS